MGEYAHAPVNCLRDTDREHDSVRKSENRRKDPRYSERKHMKACQDTNQLT